VRKDSITSSVKIALIGNPNSGKTTLFNALTGLNQKTGNFPGVTVDKKSGFIKLSDTETAEIIDLPGTYSLYPKSLDEKVSYEVLCDNNNSDHPDIVIAVADASNLKRSLFLVSQIVDLRIPIILVLNMMDLVEKQGDSIDIKKLSDILGIKVFGLSARNEEGIEALKQALTEPISMPSTEFIDANLIAQKLIDELNTIIKTKSPFDALQIINNVGSGNCSDNLYGAEKTNQIQALLNSYAVNYNELQSKETIERYTRINKVVGECITRNTAKTTLSFTKKLDNILTHKIWGYAIFLGILFLVFESLFYIAAIPTEWIESLFAFITNYASLHLPPGELTNLFINGILAGLGGIVVFVPQIGLLFAFIGILEDTGYMARVSFIMDKLLRKFGLNGRSVIPLISGVACAIPAIMSTRTISNWKERMITIMVTPLMSCSARLPVYTLLISMVVPDTGGFFNLQGLILMGLYLIGFMAAIGAAYVMKRILKSKEKSYFIMELPVYRAPQWNTVGFNALEKVKIFLFDAGKIILTISVILWFMASHAPGNRFEMIEKKYNAQTDSTTDYKIASEKLEASYAGILGKSIEPAIAPLGFDWKIGIALVTSFAAREVFVGTMATIYSVGDSDNTQSISEKIQVDIDPITGKPKFTRVTGFSLLLFYAFAMQCMSTLAVVYRETQSWKWPLIQFIYMGALAYLSALFVYQWFS
jgi:ferrous iron transport protein B